MKHTHEEISNRYNEAIELLTKTQIEMDPNYNAYKTEFYDLLNQLDTAEDKMKLIAHDLKGFHEAKVKSAEHYYRNTTPEERMNNRNFHIEILNDLIEFLKEQQEIYFEILKLEGKNSIPVQIEKNVNTLTWNKTDAEFIEWLYATLESGALKGYSNKEEVINSFSQFLGIEIKNPFQTLNGIKTKRNNDNRTIFLDKMKKAFLDYLDKEK